MAEWTGSTRDFGGTQPGLDRAKEIVVEFACATQSAALSAANERKRRLAGHVGGIGEAVRAAARSLDDSQAPNAARYVDRAAEQIEDLARALHERQWGELVGDVELVARRQPTLFVAGAVAIGFLIGRFLSVSNRHGDAVPMSEGGPAPVTAAISSASGNAQVWTHEASEPRQP